MKVLSRNLTIMRLLFSCILKAKTRKARYQSISSVVSIIPYYPYYKCIQAECVPLQMLFLIWSVMVCVGRFCVHCYFSVVR